MLDLTDLIKNNYKYHYKKIKYIDTDSVDSNVIKLLRYVPWLILNDIRDLLLLNDENKYDENKYEETILMYTTELKKR